MFPPSALRASPGYGARVITIRSRGPDGEAEESVSLDELEARIRRGEVTPTTEVRAPVLTADRWVPARELELFARLYDPSRIHVRRSFTLSVPPVLTLALVALNLAVFFTLAGRERAIPLEVLMVAGAKSSTHVFELGETWRLLAANVLHRDLVHLVFNTFFLFNLGGTLESAYRRRDLGFVLAASALGTTATSAALSDVPSMGSSGVVLGLFGAAVVFGARNADVLPAPYRRYFTGALLPYALFVLYVGLASPNTDNWGHVGGLVAGTVAAWPLRPRFEHLAHPSAGWARTGPAWATAALVLGTLAAGPVLRAWPPRLVTLEETSAGIRVAYPARWSLGENHVGFPAVGNALGATLGVRARTESRAPLDLAAVEARYAAEELTPRVEQGVLTELVELERAEREVGGLAARVIRHRLESRAGALLTWSVLVARGYLSYVVVIAVPEAHERVYAPLVESILARVSFFEPPPVTRARRLTERLPELASAELELGERLSELGDVDGARGAYLRALDKLPESAGAERALMRLALDYGEDVDDARLRARRLIEARPDDVEAHVLAAELEAKRGDADAARAMLVGAIERLGDQRELREALRRIAP